MFNYLKINNLKQNLAQNVIIVSKQLLMHTEMSYEQKLGVIAVLFELAQSDLNVTQSEDEFIERVAESFQVSILDTQRIRNQELEVPFKPPKAEWERIPIFMQCVMLMVIDRGFETEEENFCRELGFKLGLREEMVNILIDMWIESYPQPVPQKELMEVISRYSS